MKKNAIARRLARELQIPTSNAADEIDRVVHQILQNLKKGESVSLPGLGTFTPGQRTKFRREVRSEKK